MENLIDRSGFTQPDTITIKHTADDGCENSAYIVPDKGANRPEWALYYTIPVFKDNLPTKFNFTNHVIFSTFAKCLQGKSNIVWEELLNEEFPEEADRTTSAFDTGLKQYLEKVVCIENQGENFLCCLQTWKKSFKMDPVDYITQRRKMHRYATSNYLQGTLSDVGEQA